MRRRASLRRRCRIRRPLAGLTVEQDGFRRIVPEVQLLYKSRGLRPKDEADFEAVLPLLSEGERRWLDEALETEHTTHPWRERLASDAPDGPDDVRLRETA